jgi:enoyl-CoA hydratase/carnithine racemase
MTDKSSVIREKRGQAFWITINRPEKRYAQRRGYRRHRQRLSRSP